MKRTSAPPNNKGFSYDFSYEGSSINHAAADEDTDDVSNNNNANDIKINELIAAAAGRASPHPDLADDYYCSNNKIVIPREGGEQTTANKNNQPQHQDQENDDIDAERRTSRPLQRMSSAANHRYQINNNNNDSPRFIFNHNNKKQKKKAKKNSRAHHAECHPSGLLIILLGFLSSILLFSIHNHKTTESTVASATIEFDFAALDHKVNDDKDAFAMTRPKTTTRMLVVMDDPNNNNNNNNNVAHNKDEMLLKGKDDHSKLSKMMTSNDKDLDKNEMILGLDDVHEHHRIVTMMNNEADGSVEMEQQQHLHQNQQVMGAISSVNNDEPAAVQPKQGQDQQVSGIDEPSAHQLGQGQEVVSNNEYKAIEPSAHQLGQGQEVVGVVTNNENKANEPSIRPLVQQQEQGKASSNKKRTTLKVSTTIHPDNSNKIIILSCSSKSHHYWEWFGLILTGYSLSILIGGTACLTACCAGQFGCLALQAAVLDLMIVFPLNFALWVLFWVLTPLRFVWRHLLTWFVVPFVSIFHMRPSFKDAGLDKFVLAVPFAFHLLGMGNIYDTTERNVRREMRRVMQTYFPRITVKNKCCSSPISDVILTNTLFRLMIGFAMFPLAWWLCDEMYCVPLTRMEDKSSSCFDKIFKWLKSEVNESGEPETEEEEFETDELQTQQVKEELEEEEETTKNKQLEVKFVFPKCRFLMEARKTYGDRIQGNKVCRRVCRLLIEELTGQVLGHQWKVEPNMKTMRCTFSITTKPFNVAPVNDSADLEAFLEGGCKCQDKSLEW